jgi:hypothetical protein
LASQCHPNQAPYLSSLLGFTVQSTPSTLSVLFALLHGAIPTKHVICLLCLAFMFGFTESVVVQKKLQLKYKAKSKTKIDFTNCETKTTIITGPDDMGYPKG